MRLFSHKLSINDKWHHHNCYMGKGKTKKNLFYLHGQQWSLRFSITAQLYQNNRFIHWLSVLLFRSQFAVWPDNHVDTAACTSGTSSNKTMIIYASTPNEQRNFLSSENVLCKYIKFIIKLFSTQVRMDKIGLWFAYVQFNMHACSTLPPKTK